MIKGYKNKKTRQFAEGKFIRAFSGIEARQQTDFQFLKQQLRGMT